MYAVVKTGGKQYRVTKDDTILVEKLEAAEGAKVTLTDVIMLGDTEKVKFGRPTVANASVEAEVLSQTRGPKIIIFRRKRRKNHRRLQGHRQDLTLLKITDINTSAKPAAKLATKKSPITGKSDEAKLVAEKDAAPKAASKKPATKKSNTKEPSAKKAAAKKLATKKSTTKEPAAKKVAAKKPATKKSVAKEPTAKKAAAKKD